MEIFKVLAICLITAVLAVVLKQQKGEYALLTALAGGTVVVLYILKSVAAPIEYISARLDGLGVKTEYFAVSLKALGIGYVTGFIADVAETADRRPLPLRRSLRASARFLFYPCHL